jgi:hypothetical protein
MVKMRMGKILAAATSSIGAFFVLGATAFAITNGQQSSGSGSGSGGGNGLSITLVNPLGVSTFPQVVNNVIGFLATTIAIPLTVIFVLVGAFQMITSSGDPEKFTKGRKTLLYAAIGFAVALLATGVTSLIQNILNGGAP